jgi:uncharacterized membrane protein (UPF0127 family)
MWQIHDMMLGGKCLRLLVADTWIKRYRGLSGRTLPLEGFDGCHFRFSRAKRYLFSMRGMRFPLDFIWIRDRIVIAITKNVTESLVRPPEPVSDVIELPAGHYPVNSILFHQIQFLESRS